MTLTGEIRQQASTFTVGINIPKQDLNAKLDKYWEEVKDILPSHIIKAAQKGGFRKVTRNRAVKVAGGKSEFFAPVLCEIVEEYLSTQDRQALAFDTVRLDEDPATSSALVTGLVYLEPAITWKKKPGIDEPLKIQIFKEPPDLVAKLVEQELQKKQTESVVLAPLPDGSPIVENLVTILDCNSAVIAEDGSLTSWAPGTFHHNKWLVSSTDIKQPEIFQALIGMKATDRKSIDVVLNDRFGTDAGLKVRIDLHILQVFNRTIPAIDDDLAKTNGHDTIAIYRQALESAFKKKVVEQRERVRNMNILSALANPDIVEVEPIPFQWMQQKANSLYMEGRSYVKTEADFVSRFNGQQTMNGTPVTDKGSLMLFLAEQSAQNLIQNLVLRSWGKQKGVEGDTTLKNIDKYVESVRGTLDQVVVVEETEGPAVPQDKIKCHYMISAAQMRSAPTNLKKASA